MKKSLLSIEAFIKKRIKQKLKHDLAEYRILKEADLQSCFYFHLREYIGQNSIWRIYSEKSTPHGNYVDLVIYEDEGIEGFKPLIAIELKWNKKKISEKDRRSLGKALRKLRVNKGYFATVIYDGAKYHRIKKRPNEKYKLHEIVVRLGKKTNKESWLLQRERIKKIKDLSKRKIK